MSRSSNFGFIEKWAMTFSKPVIFEMFLYILALSYKMNASLKFKQENVLFRSLGYFWYNTKRVD